MNVDAIFKYTYQAYFIPILAGPHDDFGGFRSYYFEVVNKSFLSRYLYVSCRRALFCTIKSDMSFSFLVSKRKIAGGLKFGT